MARWRAEALERLPEMREQITSAPSVMALWIELLLAFEGAYEAKPPDESLIAQIYSYADWCERAPRVADAGHDPLTAVAVAFYEHIPACKPARDDMPRWFRYADVAQMREVFSYHIGDKAYQELLRYMGRNLDQHQPR